MGMYKLLLILLLPLGSFAQTPLHKLVRKHAGAAVPQPYLTSTPTSSPRNNFDGGVGFGFTVGAANMTVTDLGRWVISGNSGTHKIWLANSSGTELAAVSLNTSGLSVGYNYLPITPVVLTAGQTYYIISDEANGGDQWYDSEEVSGTADATIIGSYYVIGLSDPRNAITLAFAGTNAYVPVNFKYHL